MAGFSSEDPEATNKMRAMFGPTQADQSIRHAIQMCWMMLPDDRKTIDELERQFRRITERAIKDLREDFDAFGLSGAPARPPRSIPATASPSSHNEMAEALRSLNLVERFRELHHFSRLEFASEPVSLERFCNHCDEKANLQPDGENPQTIARVMAFITSVQNRANHDEAITDAWSRYPLRTR